jgi:hypothetical protein
MPAGPAGPQVGRGRRDGASAPFACQLLAGSGSRGSGRKRHTTQAVISRNAGGYLVFSQGMNTDCFDHAPVRPLTDSRTLPVKYSHTTASERPRGCLKAAGPTLRSHGQLALGHVG